MKQGFLRSMRVPFLIFVLLVMLAGATLWRFAKEGIPLDFLQPRIEQALSARLSGERIDIGTIELAWDIDAARLLLRLQNTRIISATGDSIAEFPSLLLGIKPWELLLQRIRLTHIVLVGGFLDIRGIDSDIAPSAPAPVFLPAAFERLGETNSVFAELETLEIRGTALRLSGLEVPIEIMAALRFGEDAALIDADMEMQMGAGDFLFPNPVTKESLTISIDSGRIKTRLDADARQLLLDELLILSGKNRIALNGSIGFDEKYLLNLQGEELVVHVEGITQAQVPIDKMTLQAGLRLPNADFSDAELDIDALQLTLPSAVVDISGKLRAAEKSPELRVSITAEALGKDELMALWPVPLETFTRDWLQEHILEAQLRNSLIRMDMDAGVLASVLQGETSLPEGSLLIETDLHDLVIDYLPPMPPIKNAKGGLRIQDNRLEVRADTAQVTVSAEAPDIDLEDLGFTIENISIQDPHSRTRLSFRGEASALFLLLQSEAIGLQQADASIEAMQSEGIVAGDLSLAMRLHDVIEIPHVALDVTAKGEGLLLPLSGGNARIEDADLDFTGSLQEMRAKGDIKINDVAMVLDFSKQFARTGKGVVAIALEGDFDGDALERLGMDFPVDIDGRIPTSLELTGDAFGIHEGRLRMELTPVALEEALVGWNKPTEQFASLQMNLGFPDSAGVEISELLLQGEDIEVRGSLRFDRDNRLAQADFPVIRIGADTRLNALARPGIDGATALEIGGDSLDIRDVIDNALGGEGLLGGADDEEMSGEFVTRGRIKRLLSHDGVVLENSKFFLRQSGDHVVDLRMDARLNETDLQLRLKTDDDSGARKLQIYSEDGGATLRGLDLYPYVVGGRLFVEADISPIGVPLQLRGRVLGDSFHVTNAPGFARLLSLASLSGIAELLAQSGIFFQSLELPFEMTAEEINLLDGDMNGPSLGLTMRGAIDRPAKQVELHGVLVPSYTLNSLLGHVPLLGELIVGRPGEGIFGVTFLINGPVDDTSIVANPLSVLTPGILRRLTEFGNTPTEGEIGAPKTNKP